MSLAIDNGWLWLRSIGLKNDHLVGLILVLRGVRSASSRRWNRVCHGDSLFSFVDIAIDNSGIDQEVLGRRRSLQITTGRTLEIRRLR